MCFSATASLVAGIALSGIGVATMAKVRNKRELPLASLPLLFGIQQLIDSAVWVSLGTSLLSVVLVYAYTLLAFVGWPIFVPFALLSIETNKVRRKVFGALTLVGLGVGLFFLYYMVFGTVTAEIVNHCVAYDTPHPYRIPVLAFYLIATCGPFFVSKKKLLNQLGIVLFLSFGIAGWFFIETFPSVWCFFAAILSGILYVYFKK